MKRISIFFLILVSLAYLFSTCGGLTPGLPSYDKDRKEGTAQNIDAVVKQTVQQAADATHAAPALSDTFVQEHLDMGSLDELKERVKSGMAITEDKASMTEDQIALWKLIIASRDYPNYTTEDILKRADELNAILDSLSEEQHQSLGQFLDTSGIQMSAEEAKEFVQSQVARFYESDSDVDKALAAEGVSSSSGEDLSVTSVSTNTILREN